MTISEGSKKWKSIVSVALAAAAVISFSSGMPAIADLNKFEAETPGEFGIGSAAQFGSADLRSHFFIKDCTLEAFLGSHKRRFKILFQSCYAGKQCM